MGRYWISTNLESCLLSVAKGGSSAFSLPHARWSGENNLWLQTHAGLPKNFYWRLGGEEAAFWWEYSLSSWDNIAGVKLPHSKIIQEKKSCVTLGITLKLVLEEQLMSLLSQEEYWDTSLHNYHYANSFTVFGASQHSTIWRAEPSRASWQCCSLFPCRHPSNREQLQKDLMLCELHCHRKSVRPAFQAIHKTKPSKV